MSINALPQEFTSYTDAKKSSFIKMKELKDQGAKVVGTLCTYTPVELVIAAGAFTVGLCGQSNDPIPAAEEVLPKNLCPLIKSSYGYALTDTCPFFYFSDMILAETTCDGKKKMYELLNEIKPTHVMQLPPGRNGDGALAAWKAEIVSAKKALEKRFNTEITEEKLRAAIKLKNRERKAMLAYFELGKLNPPPLSGYEISTFMDSSSFIFTSEERIGYLEERTKNLLDAYHADHNKKPSDRPRIMITGCPIGGVRDKIIRTIEELGADVVAIESCSGPREKMDPVDEEMEPIQALAEKYLRVNCSVMSPNPDRFTALGEMIEDYAVDGVVEVILQACHTFNIEAFYVKKYVTEEKDLPYLYLETDYSAADSEQIKTRITAFLELMQY